MFSAKRPSISPGENQARSRRICARTTAAPLAPLLSVALLAVSLIAAAPSLEPDFAWCRTETRWVAPSAPGAKAPSAAAAAITRVKRASTASVVEFGGPLAGRHAGRLVIGGPAAGPGAAHPLHRAPLPRDRPGRG